MRVLSTLLPCMGLFNGTLAQQDLVSRLPNCAVNCLEATLPMSACTPADIGCLCADTNFMGAAALCNAANCTVVEGLSSTNETYAACGIPIRDQTDTLLGTTASFGGLALLMVILRLVHRSCSAHAKLGWDDLLIGLSGFSSIFMNVTTLVAACLGFGRDMWGISAENITQSFIWLYVTYFTYQLVECFCQLSLLAFYLRLMTDRKARLVAWILIGGVTAFGIANTIAMLAQCAPVKFFWDGWKGEMTGKCIDIRLFGFIRGGVEISLDLAILSLPLPMLHNLQMNKRKRIQIMSMFCVGFVITVVSCLRIWGLVQFGQTTNPTYDNTSGVYWCLIEANLFIIVACMPAMLPVLQKTIPGCFGRVRGGTDYGYGDGRSGSGKLGYDPNRRQRSGGSLPFGTIAKSTDVKVYSEDRSASDVELVDRQLR